MRGIFLAALLGCSLAVIAQTDFDRAIPLKAGQKVEMIFDYPDVKVRTWEKNEIRITGKVSVNRGEHDRSFDVQTDTSTGTLRIRTFLKDEDKIPGRILIRKGNEEFYFPTDNYNDQAVRKFGEEHGGKYEYMSRGIIREIKLEVFVPAGVDCRVESKYGLVEVLDYNGPLRVTSVYGMIDASIRKEAVSDLSARTRYGEILTNLKIPFDSSGPVEGHENQWTEVHAALGSKGSRLAFESRYGNVYLRRAE